MKKIFSIMALLAAGFSTLTFSSCDDDDDVAAGTDREFMTMFITDNTRGKGTDYPYNCGLDIQNYPHGNTINLYWYGVNDCAGYQIQIARNGGFTKSVKTINVAGSKNKSQTIANLKKKKKYYVRVRTYTETLKTSATTAVNQKCYSEWSGVKGVKVKK